MFPFHKFAIHYQITKNKNNFKRFEFHTNFNNVPVMSMF